MKSLFLKGLKAPSTITILSYLAIFFIIAHDIYSTPTNDWPTMSQGQSSVTILATAAHETLKCKTYDGWKEREIYFSNGSRTVRTKDYKFIDISIESHSKNKLSNPVIIIGGRCFDLKKGKAEELYTPSSHGRLRADSNYIVKIGDRRPEQTTRYGIYVDLTD